MNLRDPYGEKCREMDTQMAFERDAERYRKLRRRLYGDALDIGEAVVRMKVIGLSPTRSQFDAAIDALPEPPPDSASREPEQT